MVLANSLHSPARDVHLPVCAVAGYRNSGFSGQARGEDLMWLHRQMEGLECGADCNWGCMRYGSQAHYRSPSVNTCEGRGHSALPYQPCFGMLRVGTAPPSEALGAHKCREIAHTWRQAEI